MASDILTLNAGSSSLKFSVWRVEPGTELREVLRGEIEKIGIAPRLSARDARGDTVIDHDMAESGAKLGHEHLLRELFAALLGSSKRFQGDRPSRRAWPCDLHRAGPIGSRVMAELAKLQPLAHLHQSHNISGIRTCAAL
jgi:acetate kinase